MKPLALFSPVCGFVLILCVSLTGCGQAGNSEYMASSMDSSVEPFGSTDPDSGGEFREVAMNQLTSDGSALDPNSVDRSEIKRKIIYDSEIRIEVTSFDGIPQRVKDAVEDHDGYIASSTLDGISGTHRTGTWVIKIPVKNYSDFLEEAGELGELQSQSENSTEVTAQYYDLEGRIRTKKQEETRMLKHLDEDTDKLQDTLAVEKELMRIRTELESMQGQMRLLTHQTDFSTVTLYVQEYRDYQPEQQIGFVAEVKRTFGVSISRLTGFFRTLAIAFIGAIPWLLVLILPAFFILRWISRWLKTRVFRSMESLRTWWKG